MSEKKRIQEYKNEAITVRFDPNICEHSAVCIRQLPAVFNLKARPWVNVQGADPQAIMDLIDRCPSGALSYERHNAPVQVETTAATEITVVPNGPLRLTGHIRILDQAGNLLHEADKCSLCRCGGSENKPFCDGKHRVNGFVG